MCVLVAQLCLTLCDPRDSSPPGSSVHGILQARILKWVATPFSRGSPGNPTQGLNPSLPHCRQILYHLSHLIVLHFLLQNNNFYIYGYHLKCLSQLSIIFIFSSRKLPLKEENGKEGLNSETIEIKVSNDIIQSKEDDSKA